ncbi:double zinc ribbon domain-containing protein [Salinigranum salinum]|uniref:double zinc ribbon domain-containing protein n=1 Tax=Salinigranum salinum TaxID=1364937 RepID=UPI0012609457|nr:zinc ribbon domain-containing protein [Salinigranum salinum]
MSKITFRADDDLVRRLEEFDSSKSEVMREALRAYLDDTERETTRPAGDGLDGMIAARVEELVDERLDERLRGRTGRSEPQDINVNISVDGAVPENRVNAESDTETSADDRKTAVARGDSGLQTGGTPCGQCGETVDPDHVYCPNCGEKTAQLAFCECGDELRSDWAFCPACGRRTPAADVLDRS